VIRPHWGMMEDKDGIEVGVILRVGILAKLLTNALC
jgi:hypothetical protein